MKSVIKDYIDGQLLRDQEPFHLDNDTLLTESGLLDSLSLLQLVQFLEQQFGVVVRQDELIRENFKTIDSICAYLRTKQMRD